MRRPLLLLWLATSVVGWTLLPGCKDAPESCSCCQARRVSVAPARVSVAPALAQSNYAPRGTIVDITATQPVLRVVGTDSTMIIQEKDKNVEPAPAAITLTSAKEAVPARRIYADITASARFDHAPDYTWLVGELQYLHVRNAWRVRYASVDEEDRYGGSVTLVETGPMDKFQKSGQLVRVQGRLLNADSREPSPVFRVSAIRVQEGQ